MLFAVLSKPIVTATNPSALPTAGAGNTMAAGPALMVPPLEGRGPVSTKNTGAAGGSVISASKALPLKVVVEVDVDVVVFQAETRGIEE
jgi:hypothetical protein